MITKLLPLNRLDANTGQIEGLPQNPRFIRDEKFKRLVKSIEDDPDMMSLRECIVVPFKNRYVVIAGNMRLRACKELGYTDIPCKILDADTPAEKLRAITIKDNVGFGQDDYDMLANEWDADELTEWGMDVPKWDAIEEYSEKEITDKLPTEHKCPKCGYEY